jgi:hypothetical protein
MISVGDIDVYESDVGLVIKQNDTVIVAAWTDMRMIAQVIIGMTEDRMSKKGVENDNQLE